MLENSLPPSPDRALALLPMDPDWQPIFHVSNQVVLYNPTSHALSIRQSSQRVKVHTDACPYCNRPLPPDFEPDTDDDDGGHEVIDRDPEFHSRAANYFQLLAIANDTMSRPSTPPPIESQGGRSSTFPAEAMAEGYFKAFFQEECRLGMGANGTVFLCQHMLDGNPLGHFAVKKIAVGESHSYLLKILREVRLLERLHHPNIITYHHAWLETCQFSSFGPKVPTLHVLMQWAEGGSLDDFIDVRLGRRTQHPHVYSVASLSGTVRTSSGSVSSAAQSSPSSSTPRSNAGANSNLVANPDGLSRSARIRAFRAFQKASPEERERMQQELRAAEGPSNGSATRSWTPVHLLSAEEVKSLFGDVVDGLAFLHDKSILHLDLKPGNVLLTWDEGKLIPRAMLSDFGTSRDMLHTSRPRSGNTGTLEYTSPESLPSPRTGTLNQIGSKADMWSLGMILHKLLFFKLPYRYASDGEGNASIGDADKMDQLEQEVLNYQGFKTTQSLVATFEARRLPRAFLVLLESLLTVAPSGRPSCERVSSAIREGRLNPLPEAPARPYSTSSLVQVARRQQSPHPRASPTTPTQEAVQGEKRASPELPAEKTGASPGDAADVTSEADLFLGLPAPADDRNIPVWEQRRRALAKLVTSRVLWVRTIKSSILVAKVALYPYSCTMTHYTL